MLFLTGFDGTIGNSNPPTAITPADARDAIRAALVGRVVTDRLCACPFDSGCGTGEGGLRSLFVAIRDVRSVICGVGGGYGEPIGVGRTILASDASMVRSCVRSGSSGRGRFGGGDSGGEVKLLVYMAGGMTRILLGEILVGDGVDRSLRSGVNGKQNGCEEERDGDGGLEHSASFDNKDRGDANAIGFAF